MKNVSADQLPFTTEFRYPRPYKTSVIYFLFLKDELIYIGRSDNLLTRINTHQSRDTDALFDRGHYFDQVFYLEVDSADAFDAEGAFVRYFKPIRNSSMPRNRGRDQEILARYPLPPASQQSSEWKGSRQVPEQLRDS